MHRVAVEDFTHWRRIARAALHAGLAPEGLLWTSAGDADDLLSQGTIFDAADTPATQGVPREFLGLAERVACHREPQRWNQLYRALWRLTHGEPHLLKLHTDRLMHKLYDMEKAVRRDAHKTKAFVRFRTTQDEDGTEHFVAFHRPDHCVLPLVAGFFQRRFTHMRWTIVTPDATVHHEENGKLSWLPGAPEGAPEDDMEEMWRTYYRAIFNPARIKVRAMMREMPKHHWVNLPETRIIPSLLAEAEARVAQMQAHTEGLATSAAMFLPEKRDLASLCGALPGCRGCPLYAAATQAVPGTGPANAPLMIVGEQPGDQEDRAGEPFVGPAGQVLNRALDMAQIPRREAFLTNAVKHFKFTLRPTGFREHGTPDIHEITACKPWLQAEIEAIKPRAILALGKTAARSLLGWGANIPNRPGEWQTGPHGIPTLITYHPAAILRARESGEAWQKRLEADLEIAKKKAFNR